MQTIHELKRKLAEDTLTADEREFLESLLKRKQTLAEENIRRILENHPLGRE